LFYYLTGQADADAGSHGSGLVGYGVTVFLTIILSFIASYAIVFIFQNIKSHTKLFLLIAVLLLLYALGKLFHLSSLIIILIFGLVIANIQLFFRGWFAHWLDLKKAKEIYEPSNMVVDGFNAGILLYIILGSSLIMTFAMIADKKRTGAAVNEANSIPVGVQKWKAPSIDDV